MASRLALLHDLDPEWAKQKVVPLLDWSIPEEAKGAWQGFLCFPWIRPSLWEAIRTPFLQAFDHLDALGPSKRNLAGLLPSIAIEGQDAISPREAAECLQKLGNEGRESVVIWIRRKLEGAEAQAASLWRDQIQPWLNKAWPKESLFRVSRVSVELAWAATLAREAFAEAVACVVQFVGPIERGEMILHAMQEPGLVEAEPSACLELINALTPDEPSYWFGDLGNFLDRVQSVSPRLTQDTRFRRLQDIAIRIGR